MTSDTMDIPAIIPAITPIARPSAQDQAPSGRGLSLAETYLPQALMTPRQPEPAPVSAVAEPVPARPKRAAVAHTRMPSLGVLDQLLENDSVHDILVNGTQPIYVDAGGELEDSGLRFASDDAVWDVAEWIMETVGQHWDPARPLIDTRLPDGSRVNIVAPPMSVDGVSISIRKFPKQRITLDSMVSDGSVSPEVAEFLKLAVGARLNLVIAGGTGSGKTTLLNALSGAISLKERIVTIEDSAELRLQQPHVVRLEAKQPGTGAQPESAVTIRDLVKNALRMRPDRIIVGESRGPEAFDVLQAMNTGHDGSMTTLHANTPRDAMARLETMVTMAMPMVPIRVIRGQIAASLHLIIQTNRGKDGVRRISHISEVAGMEGETVIMQDLIVYKEANGQPAGYRWVAGSSRNLAITQAAQQAGLMKGFK